MPNIRVRRATPHDAETISQLKAAVQDAAGFAVYNEAMRLDLPIAE